MDVWVEQEVDQCAVADHLQKKRLAKILSELGRRIGDALPAACQDWAATEAACRFFSNPRVDEGTILAGDFAATRAWIAAAHKLGLVMRSLFGIRAPRGCQHYQEGLRGLVLSLYLTWIAICRIMRCHGAWSGPSRGDQAAIHTLNRISLRRAAKDRFSAGCWALRSGQFAGWKEGAAWP